MSASQISSAWVLWDRINNSYVFQWTLDQISQFFDAVKINQDLFARILHYLRVFYMKSSTVY